jgi:hypothetical protein
MRTIQLLLFLLLPLTTYASGSEVIVVFWFELIAFIISMLFILMLKWKIKHKLILTIVYLVSFIYTNIVFGSMNFNHHIYFAFTLLSISPISFLLIAYLVIRKKIDQAK